MSQLKKHICAISFRKSMGRKV